MGKTYQARLTGPHVPLWEDQGQNGGFSYFVMRGCKYSCLTMALRSRTTRSVTCLVPRLCRISSDLTRTNIGPTTQISHRRVQQVPRCHSRSRTQEDGHEYKVLQHQRRAGQGQT